MEKAGMNACLNLCSSEPVETGRHTENQSGEIKL
jgi:hypothetical protein